MESLFKKIPGRPQREKTIVEMFPTRQRVYTANAYSCIQFHNGKGVIISGSIYKSIVMIGFYEYKFCRPALGAVYAMCH